jgi:hypothetical protein
MKQKEKQVRSEENEWMLRIDWNVFSCDLFGYFIFSSETAKIFLKIRF